MGYELCVQSHVGGGNKMAVLLDAQSREVGGSKIAMEVKGSKM
jgi:hypothetical protein